MTGNVRCRRPGTPTWSRLAFCHPWILWVGQRERGEEEGL